LENCRKERTLENKLKNLGELETFPVSWVYLFKNQLIRKIPVILNHIDQATNLRVHFVRLPVIRKFDLSLNKK